MRLDETRSAGPFEHLDGTRVPRIDLQRPQANLVTDKIDVEQTNQAKTLGERVTKRVKSLAILVAQRNRPDRADVEKRSRKSKVTAQELFRGAEQHCSSASGNKDCAQRIAVDVLLQASSARRTHDILSRCNSDRRSAAGAQRLDEPPRL